MEKITFKFGLMVGFLITINTANTVFVLYSIVVDDSLFWVINGAIAIILAFVHAIWIDEVLQD